MTTAQRALVEDHLAWSATRARTYYEHYHRRFALDELRSAADFGLVNAALRFDARRGIRFTTFATYLIDRELKDVLRQWRRANGWGRQTCAPHGMQQLMTRTAWPTTPSGALRDVPGPPATVHQDVVDAEQRAWVLARVRTPRERRLWIGLLRSESIESIAKAIQISPGRVCQLRRQFVEHLKQNVVTE